METLLQIGLSNAACAAGLAVIAWVVSRVVRRPAVTQVLVKLITPPIWSVPVRLPSHPGAQGASVAVVHQPATLNISVTYTAPLPTPAPARRRSSSNWFIFCAMIVWVSGATACALLMALRLRRFGKILRYAAIAPPPIQIRARQLGEVLGLRKVPGVWLLPGPVCPMVWSVFGHSRVLLPEQLWDRFSARQQSSLLAHELAHLRRRDHWVRLLELIVTPLFWWNPILWWARHEMHIAEEECCDAWVAWALPDSSDDYACALVEAIDFAAIHPAVSLLASGIGEFRSLERRLLMIQQGKGVRTFGGLGVIVVCAAAVLLPLAPGNGQTTTRAIMTSSTGDSPPPSSRKSAGGRTAKDGLSGKLGLPFPEVAFDAVDLPDVLDWFQKQTGVKFDVDQAALASAGIKRNTPVTVRLHEQNVAGAIDELVRAISPDGKLSVAFDHGAVRVTAAGATGTVEAMLNRTLPPTELDQVALGDAIDFMHDATGILFVVDWKLVEENGIHRNTPVSVRAQNETARAALDRLVAAVKPSGVLSWHEQTSCVLITPAPLAHALPAKMDRSLPEVRFNGVGFADVIDFLRDVSGEKIFVDWKALEEAGITREVPVTAHLRDVKLSKTLNLILDSAGGGEPKLGYIFDRGVIYISTRVDLAKKAPRSRK